LQRWRGVLQPDQHAIDLPERMRMTGWLRFMGGIRHNRSLGWVMLVLGMLMVLGEPLLADMLPPSRYFSPLCLIPSRNSDILFFACDASNVVLRFDTATRRVIGQINVPEALGGSVLSTDGDRLFMAFGALASNVSTFGLTGRAAIGNIVVGHGAAALVASPDGKTLYACNRFDNDVSVIDLAGKWVSP
jgi:hypothetical protein